MTVLYYTEYACVRECGCSFLAIVDNNQGCVLFSMLLFTKVTVSSCCTLIFPNSLINRQRKKKGEKDNQHTHHTHECTKISNVNNNEDFELLLFLFRFSFFFLHIYICLTTTTIKQHISSNTEKSIHEKNIHFVHHNM